MRMLLLSLLLFLFPVLVWAQAKDSSYAAKRRAPGVRMLLVDGKYKVWTQRVGEGKIKLLLLHGGPANTHEYFENFPQYLTKEGVELYFYDQLGSYHSDQPQDTSIWHLRRFVEEVEQVRQGLGLEQFYLLGHSWGGMLALEYAAKYPTHLQGLIVSNMGYQAQQHNGHRVQLNLAIARQTAAGRALLKQMRKSQKDTDPTTYQAINAQFYRQHMLRLDAEPEPCRRNARHVNRTDKSALFKEMDRWDFTPQLATLALPVLLLGGQHDYIPVAAYQEMHARLPTSEVYRCPEGGHFAMWDDAAHYFPALLRFLQQASKKE